MRIAIANRLYTLRKGGAERYCVNLCRSLASLGHEVTVLGQRIDPDLKSEVSFVRIPASSIASPVKNLSFAFGVARALRNRQFDVTLGLTLTPSVDIVRATGRIHAHWMKYHYPRRWMHELQNLNPRHQTILDLERNVYGKSRSVRRIVAQSQLEARLLVQFFGVPVEKVEVVYNGVDTEEFHPCWRSARPSVSRELGIAADSPMLLFASAGDLEAKGLVYCVLALSFMKHREARLIVLGNQPAARFVKLAQRLGVSDRVHFLGRRDDIQRYYAAADLFVFPTAYEPFPNVNLEAMACGTPVLTSATAGGADVIHDGENGYVVADRNAIYAIAERLDYHLNLPSWQRVLMSRKCRQTARSLTLGNHANRMVQVLDQVIQEKG